MLTRDYKAKYAVNGGVNGGVNRLSKSPIKTLTKRLKDTSGPTRPPEERLPFNQKNVHH